MAAPDHPRPSGGTSPPTKKAKLTHGAPLGQLPPIPIPVAGPGASVHLPAIPSLLAGSGVGTHLQPLATPAQLQPASSSSSTPALPSPVQAAPSTPIFFKPLVDSMERRVGIGKKMHVKSDDKGVFGADSHLADPPTHDEIQTSATALGRQTLLAFQSLKPPERKLQLASLAKAARTVEQMAQDAGHVGDTHGAKVKRFVEDPDGDAFRDIHAGQDEATQSKASAAYFKGMLGARGAKSADADLHREATEFMQSSATIFSAMRMPTEHVSAPVMFGGQLQGQRHPTVPDAPKIPGGQSAHSYDDRERAHVWANVGEEALKQSPATSVMAGAVAAVSYTLGHMSLPRGASNVADKAYTPSAITTQQDGRSSLKERARVLLEAVGAPADQRVQTVADPALPLDYPLSPRRQRLKPAATAAKPPPFTL
jgi:hypothetical protein